MFSSNEDRFVFPKRTGKANTGKRSREDVKTGKPTTEREKEATKKSRRRNSS